MIKIRSLVIGAFFFSITVAKAQLSGTLTVPGSYASIAAAVNALNSVGVSGPVTFNIAAGYTETAPVGGYTLTATGTAANTITFRKNGVGANPLITAYAGGTGTPGTAVQDGVFELIGSDYVTIDGIDITDPNTANPATMEFGYALYKASVTDGCQNNTIKNCVITLNRLNWATGTAPMVDGSTGIIMMNATNDAATTVLSSSVAVSGANSNNKFYSNTIQNCNIGIALIGYADVAPFTYADYGNDVGGTSAATGNTIINYGGGALSTNPATGIRTLAQYDFNASYNTINNNTGAGVNHVSTLRGILFNQAVNATASIRNNTVTIKGGGTTSQMSAIENLAGAAGTSNTITISNNLITNCSYSTATSGISYGIYNNGANARNLFINNNLISNNSTNSASGAYYVVYNAAAVSNSMTVNSNTVTGLDFSAATRTGAFYSFYNSFSMPSTKRSMNNNLIQNINYTGANPSSGTFYAFYDYGQGDVVLFQNNILNNLSLKSTGTWYLFYNYVQPTSLLACNNNSITVGLTRTGTGGTGSIYGLYNTYGSTTSAATITVNDNNLSNLNNGACTGSMYLFYYTGGFVTNFYNNIINNIQAPSGTGSLYAMYPYYYGENVNIFDNTISNITYGTGTIYGMYYYGYYQRNVNVYNNTIKNLFNNGATNKALYIYYTGNAPAYGIQYNFFKNTITDIGSSSATASNIDGIDLYSVSGGLVNVYNNIVANITATNTSNSNGVRGINVTSTNAGLLANLSYNTVYLSGTSTNTVSFGSSALFTTVAPNLTLKNNIFVNTQIPTGTGTITAFRRTAADLTNYNLASNNNLYYAGNTTLTTPIFNDGVASQQTLNDFKTLVGPARDLSSVTENPTFASLVSSSPSFLHFTPGTSTLAESGGANITGITNDYDAQTRQGNPGYVGTGSAPDIGADEFEGTSPSLSLNSVSISPVGNQCTAAARTITANVAPSSPASPITSVVLNYSFNGVAQPTIAMAGGTSTVASNYTATIPVTLANVTWFVSATDGYYTKTATGVSYKDEPLTGVTVSASSLVNPVCAGSSTTLMPVFSSTNAAFYALPPAVSSPTFYEDFVGISFGSLVNNTGYNSLVGTLGTATGVVGSYSDFTAFGPFNYVAGLTYTLAVSSSLTATYGNGFGVYIDYNRNGIFSDPGEKIYASTVTTPGPHTETAVITIPTTAFNGITRLRAIVNEGLVTSPTQAISWGEYEEYKINIAGGQTGGGLIPPFSAYTWSVGTTVVGTTSATTQSPAANTTYSVRATNPDGCSIVSGPITVTVQPSPTIPTAVNNSQCGLGVPTASVTGASNYKWYATPTSTTVLQSGSATNFSTSISASTTWYVSSYIGACESTPRLAVTQTVTPTDAVVATTSASKLCVGGANTITLTATNTGTTNTYAYTWTALPVAGSGIATSLTGANVVTTPTAVATYTYLVSANDGPCNTAATVTVQLNNLPPIISSATPTAICSGANVNLNALTFAPIATVTAIGTSSYATTGSPMPYYTSYWGSKNQYLITAAELVASGYTPGNMTSIGFNLISSTTTLPLTNFNISIGSTTLAVMPAVWQTGLTTVYSVPSYTLIPATINTHSFTTPYFWNGTDNIIIETCFNNAAANGAQSVSYQTPGYSCSLYTYGNAVDICSSPPTAYVTTLRPWIRLGGQITTNVTSSMNYVWNPGAIPTPTALVNPTNVTATPANSNFTVTVTNSVTTCSNTSSVSVFVTPVPSVPVVANNTQCGYGVPTASVSGGSGYKWYATPTSTTVLQSGAAANFTTPISATTTWYVTAFTGVCESNPRVAVTQTVTAADPVFAATSNNKLCLGGANTITLTATKTGTANTYSYLWTALPIGGSGISSTLPGSVVSPVVSGTTAVTYTYVVNANDGLCNAIATVTVALQNLPSLTASANPTMVCSGSNVFLNALTVAATATTGTVGTGSLTTTGTPNPYYTTFWGNKNQFLITAADLISSGYTIGNITSLGLYLISSTTTLPLTNFEIKMGTTALTAMPAVWQTGLTSVYNNPSYTLIPAAVNTHSFTTPFYWDGVSNIIIETCFNNSAWNGSQSIYYTTTPYVSGLYSYGDIATVCSAPTTSYTSSNRPNFILGGQVGTNVTSSMNYTWNPGAIPTATANVAPTNTAVSAATRVYTVNVYSPASTCSNSGTVSVLVNPNPATPVVSNSVQCGYGLPTASISGGTTYNWYATPTSTPAVQTGTNTTFMSGISSTTTWYVSSASAFCQSTRAAVTQSVTVADPITSAISSASACPNSSVTLTATKTGTLNTYSYAWTAGPSAGSGIPTSLAGSTVVVTPTLSGTYVYTVLATDGACNAVSTKSLYVFPSVTPPVVTATPNPVCFGNTTTLTASFVSSAPTPTYALPPAVSNALADEDFANLTIKQGTTTILSNTTPNNSLVGTIGTAGPLSVAGSYSDFTAFGPYNLVPGSVYTFSLSSSTSSPTFFYNNGLACYLDLNRNGVFTDAGELVYTSPTTISGPHTVSTTFTVPLSASLGTTRMRVISNEGLITGPAMTTIYYGEYEEYTINIMPNTSSFWTNGATVVGTTNPLPVTPTTNTTYFFNSFDNTLGCSIVTQSVAVVVAPNPTITVNSGNICAGTSFSMVPTGASTYTYSSGSAVVSPLALSSYSVVGTSSLGCLSTNTAVSTVSVTASPTITVNSGIVCAGETFTMVPTGGTSYTYTGGSAVVNPTTTTSYSVSATNTLGCVGNAVSTVVVNPLPVIVVPSAAICIGNSYTLAPTGAVTYTYSSGSNVVTPTSTTSYSVSGANSFGCVGSGVGTVTVNTLPTVTATTPNTLICNGEIAYLTANSTATNVSWSTGQTTSNISVSPTVTSTYYVNVTDNNGCTSNAASVLVTVNACIGVQELVSDKVSVYPNPSTGVLNITLTGALAQHTSIEVYDAIGKLVLAKSLTNEMNTINISNLDNGIYLFKILNNSSAVKIGKLVKQ